MDLFCTRLLCLCAFWFTSKSAFTTESALLNNTEPLTGSSTVSDEGIITFEMATQPTTSVQPDQCVTLCDLPWHRNLCLNGGSCRCRRLHDAIIPRCECTPSHEGPRCENIAESSVTVPVTKEQTSDEPTVVMITTAKTSPSCPSNVCLLYGNQCKNGATCVRNCDVFSYVTCICVYPYTGTNCSDTHEAATTESLGNSLCGLLMGFCKHGEVKCENGTLSLQRCICHENWTGEFCDRQCGMDCGFGNCIGDRNELECECWNDYTKDGTTGACTIYTPPTAVQPYKCLLNCSHHGYCVPRNDVNQMESCACWRNYTGDFCETFSPLLDAPTPTWLISMLLVLVMLCVAVLMIAVACVMYKKRRQKKWNISLRV